MEQQTLKELEDLVKVFYEEEQKKNPDLYNRPFEEIKKMDTEGYDTYLKMLKRIFNHGVQKAHDAAGPEAYFAKQRILQLKVKE